ncbi:MAG: hypothetical protein LBF59_10060 [Prevotellaceae bacterium]|jgi:hypothetical protein|nr:hypothetical protein [Prevotellaceae bacterium]
MAKNKIFSPKRFCHLVYNDLLVYGKAYALYTISIAVFLYLILWFAICNSYSFKIANYVEFMLLSGIVLGIIIGNAFPAFNNNIKAANYLLLPASALEKFLSQFLIRIVLATTLFLAIFRLDVYLAINSFPLPDRVIQGKQVIEAFSYSELFSRINRTQDKIALCLSLFSLMSFLFSMRLFFKKYAVIKTLFAGILLIAGFILVFLLCSFIFYKFSPEKISWSETLELKGYTIYKDLYNIVLYFYCTAYISWIFFLITGYYKFKEKQI